MKSIDTVDEVIAGNYCIGCGACAGTSPDIYQMTMDKLGRYQAVKRASKTDKESSISPDLVCPFTSVSKNEDEISRIFLPLVVNSHDRIGRYIRCYAGRVSDESLYEKSSSGGIGRWFLAELLKQKRVDYVVHVVNGDDTKPNSPLFSFSICSSEEEVLGGSKSAYYPVELSCVIQEIHKRDGRFAITGVPCFIKAIRNICLQDKVFAHKIAFTIGIVCGHLKSSFYGEMIAWQLGVTPNELGQVDFRVKIPGAKANEKGVSAASIEEKERQFGPKKVQEMFGTNYGYGYFKYNACDYCDDVLAEAADISIGDAWLPEFMNQGTSILVIRNKAVLEIIEGGVANRDVLLEEMTADRVAESQDAGLRHRREGLAYRLYLKLKQGVPFPVKRVAPMKSSLSPRYRCIHRLRLLLAQSSFEYFQIAKDSGSWGDFQKPMEKLNRRYESVFRLKRMRDLPGKALRFLQRKLANRWK